MCNNVNNVKMKAYLMPQGGGGGKALISTMIVR